MKTLSAQGLNCLIKNTAIKILFICLIIACSGFVVYVSCRYYANVKKWNQIVRSYSLKNAQQTANELQVLYPAFKHNDRFVFVYGKALYDAGEYGEAIPLLKAAKDMFPRTQALLVLGEAYEKTGAYSNALEAWKTVSYIKPSLFTPHYDMAKLYFKLQDYKQAKREAKDILNKKIKIDNPAIAQMKHEALDILNFHPNLK